MTGREVGNWEEQRGEIFEWSAGAVVESAKRSSRPWAEEGRRRDDQAAAAGDGDAGRMQCNATLAGAVAVAVPLGLLRFSGHAPRGGGGQ